MARIVRCLFVVFLFFSEAFPQSTGDKIKSIDDYAYNIDQSKDLRVGKSKDIIPDEHGDMGTYERINSFDEKGMVLSYHIETTSKGKVHQKFYLRNAKLILVYITSSNLTQKIYCENGEVIHNMVEGENAHDPKEVFESFDSYLEYLGFK